MGSDGLTRTDITGCRGGVGKGSGMILPVGCLYGSHCTLREMVVGVRGSGAKWKALPVWPVDILDTKKSRSDFPMRVAVMLLSICRCKIKGKFKIESDTSRDLTDTLWLDGKRSKTKANVTIKKTERNNNALMDFGAFSHLKAFYGTYMVYF